MKAPTTLDLYRETWKARKAGPEEIKTLQMARLNEIVTYARQHSRVYAERYQGLPQNITSLDQLPVVSKADLMPHFEDWVTDPAVSRAELDKFIQENTRIGHSYLGKYTVCTTSGTTGQPAVLLHDPATMSLMGALNILRAMPTWINGGELMKIIGAGMKTAAIWAAAGHFLGITMMKRQILQKPSRARAMRIFSVLSPLAEIVDGLNKFQPAMLNGYATAISLLAQEQEAGRLHIHPVLVMTSSESLSPEDRERVQKAFGCTVADNYGCSEFVAIAAGCKHGWLHVNADWVILEPVDEDLNPVAPGQPSSSVLLTNLINRIQPIIRYNLGDRITMRPDACPCGNSLPAIRVEGRTDEILRMPAPDGTIVPVLPLALWAVIKQTHGVQRFQVIRTGPALLKVRLETYPDADRMETWKHIQTNVEQFLKSQGLPETNVILAEELPMRDLRSGKFRHIWSEI
ncbi:MAG: phenylacetate--CoA ligase family protein [Anaerolineaceae bacterium]|nr:phenylacetate--CoA ligase family protein [Anaerolineaceae bacterium]